MRTIVILLSILSLLIAFKGHAQSQCGDIFRQLSKISAPHIAIQNALSEGKKIFFLDQGQKEINLVLKLGSEKIVIGALHELAPQTEVYHWGSEQEHISLTTTGTMKQASIDSRINGRDRAGGGFYVSLSPIDSASFGSHLTVSIFQKSALEIPRSAYLKILGLADLENVSIENLAHISKLRAAINFAFVELGIGAIEINSTWKVLLHESSLTQLKTPTAEQAFAAIQRLEPANPSVLQLFIEHNVPSYLKPIQNWLKEAASTVN